MSVVNLEGTFYDLKAITVKYLYTNKIISNYIISVSSNINCRLCDIVQNLVKRIIEKNNSCFINTDKFMQGTVCV